MLTRPPFATFYPSADGDESTKSAAIKEQMESKYGPTWHCIVGGDYRAEVSYEAKHFLFTYVGKTAVLLYKTA